MTNSKVKRASQAKIPFISFCRELVLELEQNGKLNTAETYTSAISSFGHFIADGTDVTLGNLNAGIMIRYENYLAARGLCRNTTSFYMRNLRAMYNRAVEKGYVEQKMPFRHVYTGVDKTVKRAIAAQAIRRIRDLDLGNNPSMDYARDMFMFSFYTRGMSFIDMAYLRKSDLSNGILSYRRQKTKQLLTIRWETQMQEIVGKPFLDHVLAIPRADDEVIEAVMGILLHDVPQNGLAADLDHGLGFKLAFFRYAGPKPACK